MDKVWEAYRQLTGFSPSWLKLRYEEEEGKV